jgi:hypothetical protein
MLIWPINITKNIYFESSRKPQIKNKPNMTMMMHRRSYIKVVTDDRRCWKYLFIKHINF